MDWLDINTIFTICSCAINVTQFLLWAKILKKTKSIESDFAILTSKKTHLIDKQRESIEEFWSQYTLWHNSFAGGWINSSYKVETIQELLIKLEVNESACLMAFSTMQLYFENDTFIKTASNLFYKTQEKIRLLEATIRKVLAMNQSKQEQKETSQATEHFGMIDKFRIQHKAFENDQRITQLISEFIQDAKKYILESEIKN